MCLGYQGREPSYWANVSGFHVDGPVLLARCRTLRERGNLRRRRKLRNQVLGSDAAKGCVQFCHFLACRAFATVSPFRSAE